MIFKKRIAGVKCRNDFRNLKLDIISEGRKLHLCPQHWKLALTKFLMMINASAVWDARPPLPTP
jgi:hypothetical protein